MEAYESVLQAEPMGSEGECWGDLQLASKCSATPSAPHSHTLAELLTAGSADEGAEVMGNSTLSELMFSAVCTICVPSAVRGLSQGPWANSVS